MMPALDTADLPAAGQPTLDWTRTFVSIDATGRLPNLSLIETVRDELRRHGIDATLIHDQRDGRLHDRCATAVAGPDFFRQCQVTTL
jgi:hypothetical protein